MPGVKSHGAYWVSGTGRRRRAYVYGKIASRPEKRDYVRSARNLGSLASGIASTLHHGVKVVIAGKSPSSFTSKKRYRAVGRVARKSFASEVPKPKPWQV